MPRTNRPRPQHARRPAERISGTHPPGTHDASSKSSQGQSEGPQIDFEEVGGDEDEAEQSAGPESADGPELEVSEIASAKPDDPSHSSAGAVEAQSGKAAESRDSGTRLGTVAQAEQPAEAKREVLQAPGGFSSAPPPAVSLEELAQRPTQLDTRPGNSETRRAVPTTTLRRVTFDRAGSSAAAESGPGANAYLGYVIDGRYRIESVIGRGGMGVVYKARHEVIDKIFAVKILLPTEDTEVVERFVNEARAASAIGNAHIVDTIDFGQLPDGSTYFVMEHLEGKVLSKVIRADKFLPIARAVNITKQIAEAMAAAHAAKIVHRDLKPENIFVTEREKVGEFIKLLDFGIAKIANAQNKLTRAGTIFGTPHYMSPEQAAGIEVDPRTDIYSLGVILYEMAAGRVPFEAENPMGLLTQHMYIHPKPLTEIEDPPQPIPIALDAIVLKCLAKKPEDRYASMTDLHADLERYERGALPAAMPELVSRLDEAEHAAVIRAAKEAITAGRKRSRVPWVLFTMLLIGGGAAGGYAYMKKHPRVEEPLPQVVVPEMPATQEPIVSAVPAPPQTPAGEVAIVFEPLDSQVFLGNTNLGPMPVTLTVKEGEHLEIEIRREGFTPLKLQVDGSKALWQGKLTPIPGVKPTVPVPTDSPDRVKDLIESFKAGIKDEPAEPNEAASAARAPAPAPVEHPAPKASAPAEPASAEAPSGPSHPSDNPYEETP